MAVSAGDFVDIRSGADGVRIDVRLSRETLSLIPQTMTATTSQMSKKMRIPSMRTFGRDVRSVKEDIGMRRTSTVLPKKVATTKKRSKRRRRRRKGRYRRTTKMYRTMKMRTAIRTQSKRPRR